MVEIIVGLIILWIFRDKEDNTSEQSEENHPYMYDHLNNFDNHD